MITVGIDEVGRGCWAGPVVAGAVVLGEPIAGLADSKKLSKAARMQLDVQIREQALAYGVGWVDAATVDTIGLTAAVAQAMEQALAAITVAYDEVIIDGHYNFLPQRPHVKTLVKADNLVPAVSAASIIAKVARDGYMASLPKRYDCYNFGSHVGYGTQAHQQTLATYGPCDLHRLSFKPLQKLATIHPKEAT